MPFIFYDVETTGTATTFDQILQFAAVLADDNLREIDAFSIRCQRLPHIVPSPGALLVTGIRPSDLSSAPHSHYSMMLEIHRRLQNWSRGGAVFLGWNSLRFDETFLRQAYYQTLLPIYQTNTQGNSRADVMRIAQACAIYAPGRIVIPVNGDRHVFKLGEIAGANGIVLDHAHEALADTRATLAVAKLIRERAPDVWETMLENSRKPQVEAALRRPILGLSHYYAGGAWTFVVTAAAWNPGDASDVALFDLSFDPELFFSLSEEGLLDWISGTVKAVRCIRTNAQPMLFQIERVPETVWGGRLPLETYEARAGAIRANSEFQARLGRAIAGRWGERPPSPDVEARIYDGFPDYDDQARMSRFHTVGWEHRIGLAREVHDPRLRVLAQRLIYVERRELLSHHERTQHDAWVAHRLMTKEDVPWITIPKALQEVANLKTNADAAAQQRLNEIEEFLYGLAQQYGNAMDPERA